jgi:AcrR family transcriptional regulator
MQPLERSHPTQSRSQQRVQKIVQATQEMLAKYGYEETTIKRIADAAGIKQTSIYRYYPNKRAVISVLADIFVTQHNNAITHCIEESLKGQPAQKILKDFISILREGMVQNRWIHPAQLAMRSDPQLREQHEDLLDHFGERFSLLLKSFGVNLEGNALFRVAKTLVLILDAYMLAIGRATEEVHTKVQEDFEQVINSYLTSYLQET